MSVDQSVRSRKAAERRGRFAESLAAWSYRFLGYRVFAERYRTPFGEIDLVLRRGKQLVFVEVKARRSFDQAIEALRPRQQRRLTRAAEIFLGDHPGFRCCSVRFDLVAISPWHWPYRIKDAWQQECAF